MQPQKEPYLPCRTSMGRPQSGHAGAFASDLRCAEHTGCFCLLYEVAVFPHTAQFMVIASFLFWLSFFLFFARKEKR